MSHDVGDFMDHEERLRVEKQIAMSKDPPSMDEKDIPSPSTRTQAQYDADKAAGFVPYSKTFDRNSWSEEKARREELASRGLDWRNEPPYGKGK